MRIGFVSELSYFMSIIISDSNHVYWNIHTHSYIENLYGIDHNIVFSNSTKNRLE